MLGSVDMSAKDHIKACQKKCNIPFSNLEAETDLLTETPGSQRVINFMVASVPAVEDHRAHRHATSNHQDHWL